MSLLARTPRSIILTATLIAVTSVAAIVFSYALSQNIYLEREWGQVATARSIQSLFGVLGFGAWLRQLAMLASTAVCSIWLIHLRSQGTPNAAVLVCSIWILVRSLVFALLWITDAPIISGFALLIPEFASVPSGFWVTVIAMITSVVGFTMTIKGMQRSWIPLVVAVPAIAMSFVWNLAYIGHTLPIDVWFTPLMFAWIISRRTRRDTADFSEVQPFRDSLRTALHHNWISIILMSFALVALSIDYEVFARFRNNPNPSFLIFSKWVIVAILSAIAYVASRDRSDENNRWEWTALMCLTSTLLVSTHAFNRIPNEIPLLQFPIYATSFIVLLLAIPSLALRKIPHCWAFGVALLWPQLIVSSTGTALTLTDSAPYIGPLGLLDLSITTAVFWLILIIIVEQKSEPRFFIPSNENNARLRAP